MTQESSSDSSPQPNEIARLLPADIKDAWPSEAQHFTPWLLANADYLSEVLGLQLQLDKREYKVGTFSLDLIGKVSGSDEQIVIVENQFGETDHRHLGQIMTYAGGTDPTVVVWIAESFREEHRAALDWLNHNTTPDVKFFGIQLSAVRMEGAPAHLVAPRLDLVCKPNDWEKLAKVQTAATAAGTASGMSSTNALYKRFWELFAVPAKKRGWTSATPPAQNWWSLPTGNSTITWGVSFATFGCRSELYFGDSDPAVNTYRFQMLSAKAEAIQEAYGPDPLYFDELPNNKACRVEARLLGPKISDDEATWADVVDWMLESQTRLRKAIADTGGIPTGTPPAIADS